MENTNLNKLDLSDDIAEVECSIEKIRFLLGEFDMYDYTYEVTPRKALDYAMNKSIEPDCELSYRFCSEHKRIMNIYHILRDYVYEAESKLAQIQESIVL